MTGCPADRCPQDNSIRCSCRHIFSDRLYVEEYNAGDFETELGLDREKLIHLALLLGSDYTDGVAGIGIVNAVSIIMKHFVQYLYTLSSQ